MEVQQCFGVHRKNNLPHRGGGFIASVHDGEVFVVVYKKCGDGTVIEPGNHDVVVIGGIANDSVDGNEVAEDDGVVVEVFHEVADVVFVAEGVRFPAHKVEAFTSFLRERNIHIPVSHYSVGYCSGALHPLQIDV